MTALDECRACRSWPSTTADGLCDICATEADQAAALCTDMRFLIDTGLIEVVLIDGIRRYQLTSAGRTRIESLHHEER